MENVCIHDNIINAFKVDIDNETINIGTTSEDAQTVTITFRDVLAHKFDNVIKCNILLDIVENTISDFLSEYKECLIEWLKYGFPTYSCSYENLESYLAEKKYKIFIIQASLGMSGFVIAKSLDFVSAR